MKVRYKSLSSLILLTLEKSVDGFVRVEDFMANSHIYAKGYERNLKKSAISKALKRLRENGLIDFVSDQELVLKLTRAGEEHVLMVSMSSEDQNWDGKWRLVVFDIPEKRRAARDLLRSKLKQWGFIPWQKSLWATKKNCTKLLREFIKNAGIEDWVLVIESDNIGFRH